MNQMMYNKRVSNVKGNIAISNKKVFGCFLFMVKDFIYMMVKCYHEEAN